MKITARNIDSFAPNASAAKNGRELAMRNRFSRLCKNADNTLLWGECSGSGKTPYTCSADFIRPENPVFRCSCPSRQFPCKHCLGLLHAYENGLAFATAELPDNILSGREKLEKRQEKKAGESNSRGEAAAKTQKVNNAAAIKKIDAQLAGLVSAGKILDQIVYAGLSSFDANEKRNIQARIKELGNAHIPGVQTAFHNLLLELDAVKNEECTKAIEQITFLSALIKKSAEYLSARRDNPETARETGSEIEEQIGHVWKLTELTALGLCENDAELVQLSFDCYDNLARREYVDEGIWINLKNGRICRTRQYRPYRAAKHIIEEDSFPDVAQLKELYVYPGGINPRVRWEPESLSRRPLGPSELRVVHSHAAVDYARRIKEAKGAIKNPLADKNPLLLLALDTAWVSGGRLVVKDASGFDLLLRDLPGQRVTAEPLLRSFLPARCSGMSLLVRIANDVTAGLFAAQPLSVVVQDRIIKLFY